MIECLPFCLDLPSPLSFEHSSTIPNHHDPRTSIDVIREMTCSTPIRQEHRMLTVLDVYDEAALIGKDFERIIESKTNVHGMNGGVYFFFCNSLWN